MIIMNSKISKKGLVLFLVLILLLIGSIATARIAASNVNKKYIESNEKKDQGIHDWGYNSKSGEYNNFRNYNEIGKLTSDILNNQNGFIGVSDPTIFLGKVYKYEGWNGLQATEYANGMCAAHYQSNTLGGDNVYYIANVIDINTDPDNLGITIYGGKRTEKEGTRLYVTDEKNDVPNSADVGNAVASAIWISLSDPNYLQCDKDENGNDIKSMRTCHKIVSYALENYITTIARELDEEFLKKNKYGYRTEYRNNTVVNSNNVDIRKYLNSEFSNFHLDTGWKNNGVPQGVKDQIYAAKTVATTHKVTVESAKVNNKEIADITYKGDYAYIGPLKITSEGEKTFKLKSITVNGQKASLVKKGALDTDITSGSSGGDNYYAKIKNKTITTATVKVTTESSSSVPYYKARILVCIAPASNKQNQNTLIYAAQKSTTGSDSDDSVTIERKTTKVQLQKTDSADKALSLSGIKFEIYKGEVKSENKKGTLETGSDGKTGEIELEAGTYTVKETVNNAYGYKQNKDVTTTIKIEESDISKNIVTKNIKNTKELGNLQITKISDVKDNGKEITLSGAQFKIGTGVDDKFIQLTDTNKKKIGTVPGSATISTDGSNIKYVAESEATIFKTDSNGIIELKNLEVYSAKNIKYNYQIKEINTGNSNYTILNETTSAKLDNNTTKSVTIKNKLSYIDLSGKVWLDVPQGKAYTGNNEYDSNDKKLKDIKVILYDTVNKKNIANTKTDENGNYKFTRVSRDNLKNYSVVFEYDGLKYTSVTLANNINETNKSKAKEVWGDNATTEKTRQFVNSKYTNIPDNGNAIKTAAGNNIVQASTQEAGDKFNLSKATIDVKAKEIKNIDLGLFTREQPDISITDDITSLIVKVKDSQYIYNYEHIGDAKEEREAKNQTVNLTAKVAKKGKLYASDIKSFQDSVAKMEVYVIYGIQIKNESQTLKTNIKQVNEFYDIEKFDLSSGYSIGSNANNGNLEGANKYKVTEVANANGEPKLNKLEITFNQELKLEPGQKEMIYLKFKLNDETVKGVLNKDAAIYNVATIAKYESNYFEGVDENGKKIETYEGSGTSRKDKIYAGLDKDSIPNNEEIQFEKDGQGNNKLYDMNLKATTDQSKGHAEIDADKLKSKGNFGIDLYEDDAFSAPTFVLYADSVRKIEGTAFEDKSTVNNDNERKGNGKLDNNENKLKDITVELLEAESGNVAKYSDGITEVRAKQIKTVTIHLENTTHLIQAI